VHGADAYTVGGALEELPHHSSTLERGVLSFFNALEAIALSFFNSWHKF
jgi:hypothetical protein